MSTTNNTTTQCATYSCGLNCFCKPDNVNSFGTSGLGGSRWADPQPTQTPSSSIKSSNKGRIPTSKTTTPKPKNTTTPKPNQTTPPEPSSTSPSTHSLPSTPSLPTPQNPRLITNTSSTLKSIIDTTGNEDAKDMQSAQSQLWDDPIVKGNPGMSGSRWALPVAEEKKEKKEKKMTPKSSGRGMGGSRWARV